MVDEEKLPGLLKQRGTIKGRLTRFEQYVQKLEDLSEIPSVKYKELLLKVDKIQTIQNEYDTLQSEINLISTDTEEQIQIQDEIENRFCSVIARMQVILDACPFENKSDRTVPEKYEQSSFSSSSKINTNLIKLPTINLPSFDGNYMNWLEFKETFESVIDKNVNISPIAKFHYLRSSIRGSAAVVIKSVVVSGNNYKVAWDLLCQRFDNKNLLVNKHLKALFSIDPLQRESYKALSFIVDHVSKHLGSLKSLGQPTDMWDALIIFMVSSKLDASTSGKWEENKQRLVDMPTLQDFFDFLQGRIEILGVQQNNRSDGRQSSGSTSSQSKCLAVATKGKSFVCYLCSDSHLLHVCPKFNNLNVDERISEIEKLNLCKNCFGKSHNSFKCQLKGSCRRCHKRHNTLLHKDLCSIQETSKSSSTSNVLPIAFASVSPNHVLLCTALVDIEINGKSFSARALLDTGSQSSFVTEKLKNKIGLSTIKNNAIKVCGISNAACDITEMCYFKIKSRLDVKFEINIKCLVVPQITGIIPNTVINPKLIEVPANIQLADPKYFSPAEVDILLGSDVYWDVIESHLIRLGSIVLQQSKLGYLVGGPIKNGLVSETYCNFSQDIKDSLERFWKIDELTPVKTYSVEERLCEEHFTKTMSRLDNGRFVVSMPLKEDPEVALGDSYYMAKKCLLSLEKKFKINPKLKSDYCKFIEEYSNLGHLTRIPRPDKLCYYLPHHAVIRSKSTTTKLRVVFNASAKSSSGKSLNDIQMVGPVVQSDLISILLRFREHKYILTADIEKMFRQFELDSNQRHLQLILWRADDTKPIEVLQLNTVTYGTASAPFLSTRCLVQLANECEDNFIANIIKNDFYADDLNTGSDSIESLKYIHSKVTEILESACLPLRKFHSNCSELSQVAADTSNPVEFSKESTVLGLNWSPKSDSLQFSTDLSPSQEITKRTVISVTAQVFDPLGLLSPCIIVAKILLQQLWTSKLDWDDPVPPEFCKNWSSLLSEFENFPQINIPRRVLCDNANNIQVHCFVDASQQAYAACVFLRSENDKRDVSVSLLCAKTRVAPLKPTTIPRLELCGLLLGARLCSKVLNSLRCNITKKVIWTDSTVVLAWVRTPPRDLKTYVCNRVNEIIELTPGFTFRHIPTHLNPADMASRGMSPKQLQSSSLWWGGPTFLTGDSSIWPTPKPTQTPVNLPELKNTKEVQCYTYVCSDKIFIQFDRFSSFTRMIRSYAYVLRFINNCGNKTGKNIEPLDALELDYALSTLIKFGQAETFIDEINALKGKRSLPLKSKLLSLNPFIDDKGILRVGGRMKNSVFNFDKRHPMILDSKHRLTQLLFQYEHQRLFHAGPQHLLASIRERYWPIGGRILARSTARKCVVCVRLRGYTIQPIMGNLPTERSNATFPFHSCGVDYAGPFLISSKKGKGNRISKCYLCLFICLATKAVHLEIVSDLSTEAFILSLRRFVSRRGKPRVIFSDNGTNFKGANNELGKVIRASREPVANFACNEGIKFIFTPAYSPHFGGIWEAGVKSAKSHLKRIAGNASLTFEEITTLFTQIEAILNSRPLTPLSPDPTDLNPLTPGHFLIGRPLTSVPSGPVDVKRPTRYQLIEKLRGHFWSRWTSEYIAELQQRSKWKVDGENLNEGDLCLVKETDLPPLQWSLGRVTQLYPGTDGVARVADVLTRGGIKRRAVNKLCPLILAREDVNELKQRNREANIEAEGREE